MKKLLLGLILLSSVGLSQAQMPIVAPINYGPGPVLAPISSAPIIDHCMPCYDDACSIEFGCPSCPSDCFKK